MTNAVLSAEVTMMSKIFGAEKSQKLWLLHLQPLGPSLGIQHLQLYPHMVLSCPDSHIVFACKCRLAFLSNQTFCCCWELLVFWSLGLCLQYPLICLHPTSHILEGNFYSKSLLFLCCCLLMDICSFRWNLQRFSWLLPIASFPPSRRKPQASSE